ncbi:MAG: hypothetical protein JNK65_09735, partial [Deltaproteobacteria bacterium]|nr:hypothetical protein [Deltaproteobacteria bacterium]
MSNPALIRATSESLLARLSQQGFEAQPLTSFQNIIDQNIGHFSHELTRGTLFAGMALGSLANVLTRTTLMGLASPTLPNLSLLIRPTVYGLGIVSEAAAFEGVDRIAAHSRGETPSSSFAQSLRASVTHFTLLRGASFLTKNTNLILQHSLTSTTIVAGNSLTAALDW